MKRLLISLALAGVAGAPVLAQDTPTPKPEQKKEQSEAQKKAALEARITDLVDQLGAKQYKVRQQAYKELVAIGPPAVKALEGAKKSEDPEVAASAAEALAAIRAGHKLPTPKSKKAPRGIEEDRGMENLDPPRLQPIPGQDEMLEQLQKQFPEMRKLLEGMRGGQGGPGFRLLDPDDPMFKELFGGRNPFEQLFGGQGEEEDSDKPGTRSRSRTFTWSNVPQRHSGPSLALGLSCRAVSPVLRSQLSLPAGQGLAVHRLTRDSFAKTQGVQQYDILLEVDGKPIRNELDLRELVAKGGKVTILRQAKRQTLTFAKAPKVEAAPTRPRRLRPVQPRQPEPKKPSKPGDETREF